MRRDATVRGMTESGPRPTSYSRVSLGIMAHSQRGQPPRQRPRRRDHEARRLHGRRGGLPPQRGSRGHRGDGRDDLPRAGPRRRHHQDLRPGQLGRHLLDGDRRARRGAAVGQRGRRAAARGERLLRLRRHRRRRPAAAACRRWRPRPRGTYDASARPRSAARTGWRARPRSTGAARGERLAPRPHRAALARRAGRRRRRGAPRDPRRPGVVARTSPRAG